MIRELPATGRLREIRACFMRQHSSFGDSLRMIVPKMLAPELLRNRTHWMDTAGAMLLGRRTYRAVKAGSPSVGTKERHWW